MTALPSWLPLYWDQAELDRQYDTRGIVPDILPCMAKYSTCTLAVTASQLCQTAIRFGPTEPQRLDVYPAGQDMPVFMFIQDGCWPAMASLDEIVRQRRAALDWVHNHIAEYGDDLACIPLNGTSAGAHLTSMLAAAPEQRV